MATVVYPNRAQWRVLMDLGILDGGIVLISPDMAGGLSDEQKERIDDLADSYDFGGSPDISADVVASQDHYFITEIQDIGEMEAAQ